MRVSYFAVFALPFLVSASLNDQSVLSPTPLAVPHEQSMSDADYTPLTHVKPTIADLLTIEPSASIYYSYARETELSKEFNATDQYLTLLVPTNKAIMAQPRKPHQGPASSEPQIELSEQQFDEQSQQNILRWVSAHIIPTRVSLSNLPVTYDTMLEGKSITFISDSHNNAPDWERVTLEDGTRIISMKKGMNGVVLLIDGIINPY
ncbi:hypothetical protein V8B97DRAFT_1970115 [Scleroderma yunnanense]